MWVYGWYTIIFKGMVINDKDICEGYDRDAFDREAVGVHKEPLNPLARFNIFKKAEE